MKNNNNEPPKQKRIKNKKFPSAYNNLSNDMLNKQSHIIINNNYNDKEKVSDKISPKKSLSFIRHKKLKKKIKRKKKIINNNVVKYKLPISIPLSSSDLIKPENNRNQYKKQITINKNEAQILNDHELNNLEYELALEIDKRTYFQYYFSLLKKKHLILFTFLTSNDYNLFSIKISLFIFSFALYFTINGFFFSDETMDKIYKNTGKSNIILQIPQILYSSVITSILNSILKRLSLSEIALLTIKQEKNIHSCVEKSKKIERNLKIKFFVFFNFSFLFMLFFWYFISCFCAVYKNTQKILLNDTLLSFGISMLYPFGLNLIPGLFRIPALRSKERNRKCIFKFSKIVAFI